MHVPRLVPLHFESTWLERPLLPSEDVEVVIRSMQPRVSLSTEGCTENDEVFSNGCMDDVHGTHGTPSIIEHPFRRVGVERNLIGRLREGRREVRKNVLNHAFGIVGGCSNGVSCKFM